MKRLNINELIWLIIISGYTYYIYMLVSTGRISAFIHPKMLMYVLFSLCVFALLSVFQIRKIFMKSHNTGIKPGFIIFLVPLILGFAVNPGGLNSDVASKKGVTISKSVNSNNVGEQTKGSKDKNNDGILELNEKNFVSQMEYVQGNVEKLKGKKVIISGFVFKDEDFKPNVFVTARMLVSCCAADAQVIGLMCRLDKGKAPEKDQWVKVIGILDSTNYIDKYTKEEMEIPIVVAETIEIIPKPAAQYVYP